MKRLQLPALFLCSLVAACGTSANDGSNVDTPDRDPRRAAACPETMPQYDGVGPVCNATSRVHCLDECEARIAGVPTICQSCLLENSCFDPGGCFGVVVGGSCVLLFCLLS